ncbi:MAG: hypothetical protein ACRC42_02490, partial [Mycoplasma sp.]
KNQETSILEKEVSETQEKCLKDSNEIARKSEEVQKELDLAKPKLVSAQSNILAMDKEILMRVTGGNVANSIRFYFECAGLIMNKRLAIPKDFGDLVINKDITVNYYYPLGWATVFSYLKSSSEGGFFNTIEEWKIKLKANKLNINDETLELIRPFLEEAKTKESNESIFEEKWAKKIGGDPCLLIANFCKSIRDFVFAVRDVIPKMQQVAIMENRFQVAKEELDKQTVRKNEVLAIKKKLEDGLAIIKAEQEEQKEKLQKMKKKVDSAQHLIDSWADEKVRWEKDSQSFGTQKNNLLGDAAICAAFLAYSGPFNSTFRDEVLEKKVFKADIVKRSIPYSAPPVKENKEEDIKELKIEEFLVNEITKNEWSMSKLPSDN